MFLVHGNDVAGTARGRLVDGLVRMARAYETPSVVVFDGAPSAGLPRTAARGLVRVLYSGRFGSSADRILDLVAREGRRRAVVITSDRSLACRVRELGGCVAPVFLLRRALAQPIGGLPQPGGGASITRSRPDRFAS